jgi:hypothetical protein
MMGITGNKEKKGNKKSIKLGMIEIKKRNGKNKCHRKGKRKVIKDYTNKE